jgi:myo-inositol-1(or 4)-monophosphatase
MSGTAATEFVWVPKATEIAREAGAKLREFFAQGVKTEYKGDVDLVTVADRTSEKLIRERLSAAFPTHGIYGEEGTRERLASEFRWYVDPLDGTTNFAHGFPHFCVSMGLEQRPANLKPEEDGTLVAAVLYDPLLDELFTAERGRGALLNGKPMHVSPTPDLAESLIATGFPSRKRHASPNVHFYQEFTLRSHGVRRAGSAALDLAYVACGRMEGFWEFNLNPWARHGLRRPSLPARQPRSSGLEWADSRGIGRVVQRHVRRAQLGTHSHTPGICCATGSAGKMIFPCNRVASLGCTAVNTSHWGLCYHQRREV